MEEKKNSNIFGIPYVIIIFVFVATIPSLISDAITRNEIKNDNLQVLSVVNRPVPTPIVVTPTASPSATMAPVVRGLTTPKTLFTPTTGVKK